MSKVIEFEKHRTVLLTRVADVNPMLATFADFDGQKYIAMPSFTGMCFIPLFEDGKQMVEYEKKYGGIKRKYAVSSVQAVGAME